MDVFQGAVVPPLVEIPPDGALGREVLGQVSPLAPSPEEVQDGIHDIPKVRRPRPPARVYRQERLDQCPLGVREVTRVVMGSHTPFYPPRPPLWDSH